MTEQQRKEILNISDFIKGEINRMCVTNVQSEFFVMLDHAEKNLDKLSKMIYDARFCVEEDEK